MTAPPVTLYAIQIHFPLPHSPNALVPSGTELVPSKGNPRLSWPVSHVLSSIRSSIILYTIAPSAVSDAVASEPSSVHQKRASSPKLTPAKRHM